jgi:hypothetical protein
MGALDWAKKAIDTQARDQEMRPLEPATAMGRRAYDWLVRHADELFALRDGRHPELERVIRCAELALIVGSFAEATQDGEALVGRAWDALGRGEDIARLLPTAPAAANAYLPFRLAGFCAPELERRLGERSWLRGHARLTPFTRFAIGVTLEQIGVAPPWDMAAELGRLDLFERPTPATQTIKSEYLAHAVMWRSEMGRNRAGIPPRVVAMYRAVSAEWQPLLAKAGWLEPLAELAIADLCTGATPPATSLDLLCAHQREDGSVPVHINAAGTSFDDVYHSTGAAALCGMLVACRLHALPKRRASAATDLFGHYAD